VLGGFVAFLVPDLVKIVLAATLARRLVRLRTWTAA
jgi:biotin transporter BioY